MRIWPSRNSPRREYSASLVSLKTLHPAGLHARTRIKYAQSAARFLTLREANNQRHTPSTSRVTRGGCKRCTHYWVGCAFGSGARRLCRQLECTKNLVGSTCTGFGMMGCPGANRTPLRSAAARCLYKLSSWYMACSITIAWSGSVTPSRRVLVSGTVLKWYPAKLWLLRGPSQQSGT